MAKKTIVLFFLILISTSGYAWYHDQISISPKSTDIYNGMYAFSKTYNDQFNQEASYQYTVGRTEIYKAHKVKEVKIFDLEKNLVFYCKLDTAGRVIEQGQQLKSYFVVNHTIQVDKYNYITVVKYFKDNWIIKIDSTLGYYQDYKNGDTNLYYSRQTRINYLLGSVVNERNDYYNEKYYNKTVVINPNSPVLSVQFYGYLGPEKYFEKKFKTDYYSGKLYRVNHIISTAGYHHYAGQTELNYDIINWHPFFKDASINDQQEFYLDGIAFNEPRMTYERMWCGNSMNRPYYSDNGVKYRYTKNSNGLYENYYRAYYPKDTSAIPIKVEQKKPKKDTLSVLNILPSPQYNRAVYVRRLKEPIKTKLFTFSYTYF